LAAHDNTKPLLAPIPERAVASVYELRQLALYRGGRLSACIGAASERSCGDEEKRDL